MMRRFSNLFCSVIMLLLALSAVSPAMAQQGQYHLNYLPFSLATLKAGGALATYSPINSVDGQMLLLRDDDGIVYTFSNLFCSVIMLLLALSAVSPAMAQQDQYHLNYLPFSLATLKTGGGLATYSPINSVDGQMLLLRDDDGI